MFLWKDKFAIKGLPFSRSLKSLPGWPVVSVESVFRVQQDRVHFAAQIEEVRVGPPHLRVEGQRGRGGHEERSSGSVLAVIEMVAILPRAIVELIDGHEPLAEMVLLEDAMGAGEQQD